MTFVCLLFLIEESEREREIRDSYACNILFMILKNDQCVKKKENNRHIDNTGWNSNSRSLNKTIVLLFKRMFNNCSLSKSSHFLFMQSIDSFRIISKMKKNSRGCVFSSSLSFSFSFYIDNSINCI